MTLTPPSPGTGRPAAQGGAGGPRQGSRRPAPWPAAALGVLALLAGCATPPAAPSGELLSGRLSVRVDGQPERAVAGGFELSGDARDGQLLLSGPLGTTAAKAQWSAGQALLLRGDAPPQRFDTLDALAAAALGEAIPIAALFDWLRGRAWPGAAATPRADGAPGFEQLGWRVGLARWAEGWVEAVRLAPPAITVRARLETPG